ncbi:hypothetical protein MHBO_003153, partial [Bonamia ostreae]
MSTSPQFTEKTKTDDNPNEEENKKTTETTPTKPVENQQNNQTDENIEDRKLFIGGVSRDTTLEEFRHFFMTISKGKVIEPIMPVNQLTGNTRGFGFVGFQDKSDYDNIVQLSRSNQLIIKGKNVEAKPASEKPKRKNLQRSHFPNYASRPPYNYWSGFGRFGANPNMYGGEMEQNMNPYQYGAPPYMPARNVGQNGGFEKGPNQYPQQQSQYNPAAGQYADYRQNNNRNN